jgi:Mg2+-importing ATPase
VKKKRREGSINTVQTRSPKRGGRTWVHRLFTASRNPLVILLTVLASISYATGDLRAGSVMLLMVILGLGLRFVQETRANAAAAKLKAMISVTATVVRNGEAREIPISQLVPGDIVQLSAGDMIPADVRLISAKDLFIIQATLTGESLPVEKIEVPDTRQGSRDCDRLEHLLRPHRPQPCR